MTKEKLLLSLGYGFIGFLVVWLGTYQTQVLSFIPQEFAGVAQLLITTFIYFLKKLSETNSQ